MALQEEGTIYPLKLERDEARQVADEAMRWAAHRGDDGKVRFEEPRNIGTQTVAIIWLAAETRAARLERAYERELDRGQGVI